MGGGVLLGQEVEAGGEFLVPEEGAGSTEAENESHRGKADLFSLSQLRVQFVDHGLRCWVVNQVHDVEVGVVKIVLEERKSVLPRRDVYASQRRAPGARMLATACDAECEQITVINNLGKGLPVSRSAAHAPRRRATAAAAGPGNGQFLLTGA